MEDPKSLALKTVELPIRRVVGSVKMKSHQVQRDARRGGKTSRAAARLAHYRLRSFLRVENQTPVDDVELQVGEGVDDFIRNQRTVVATVRCVDRHEVLGDSVFRVPPSTSVLRVMVPDASSSAS